VTLDARRLRLWRAMGLGPVWQMRGAAVAAVTQEAGGDPRAARIAQLDWDDLAREVAACADCPLGQTRRQAVYGVGYRHAEWMLVGEAPGAEEDARGEPFVGQAGKLLDNMLASIGLTRQGETPQSVFVANVLKCRPPNNRNPEPLPKWSRCEPFLRGRWRTGQSAHGASCSDVSRPSRCWEPMPASRASGGRCTRRGLRWPPGPGGRHLSPGLPAA
jgi:hypothetical protein